MCCAIHVEGLYENKNVHLRCIRRKVSRAGNVQVVLLILFNLLTM